MQRRERGKGSSTRFQGEARNRSISLLSLKLLHLCPVCHFRVRAVFDLNTRATRNLLRYPSSSPPWLLLLLHARSIARESLR